MEDPREKWEREYAEAEKIDKQRRLAAAMRMPNPELLAEMAGMDSMDSRDPRQVMRQLGLDDYANTPLNNQSEEPYQDRWDAYRKRIDQGDEAGYPYLLRKERPTYGDFGLPEEDNWYNLPMMSPQQRMQSNRFQSRQHYIDVMGRPPLKERK